MTTFVKTTIQKADFKPVEQFGSKFIVRVLAVEREDAVTCVECIIDHKPTAKELSAIEAEAEAEYLPLDREQKLADLIAYDESSAVNEFTLAGNKMWLKLDKRKDLRQSLIALKSKEIEEFTYWNDLTPITLPVSQYEYILNEVEVYALQCFNVTAQHKANIMALTSLAEVEAYDFTTGYPEKLSF